MRTAYRIAVWALVPIGVAVYATTGSTTALVFIVASLGWAMSI